MDIRIWVKNAGMIVGLVCALMAPGACAASTFIFGHTPVGAQKLILNGNMEIDAVKTGWVTDRGQSEGVATSIKNYFVGGCDDSCGQTAYRLNDYFVFDLTPVQSPITSAVLSVGWSSDYDLSNTADASWNLHDMSGIVDEAGSTWGMDDAEGKKFYSSIASGTSFGSWKVDRIQVGTQLNVALNSAAIQQINSSQRKSFGIGGTLSWRDITAAIPEPSTWLMMIVGFALIGCALRRRPVAEARTQLV
jgi:hypothetical protein